MSCPQDINAGMILTDVTIMYVDLLFIRRMIIGGGMMDYL